MSQTDPSARLTATAPLCNGQEGQAPVFVKKKSTKDYSDTVRVYDTDGFRLRSDAICFSDKHKSKVCCYWQNREGGDNLMFALVLISCGY